MMDVKAPEMSRVHYAFIADIICRMEFNEKTLVAPQEYVASVFTDALRRTSPNFKGERFFDAALGLTKAPKPAKSKSKARSKSSASRSPRDKSGNA